METITFEGNSALETVGKNAFYDCDAVTQIVIPASVTTIGEGAFNNCDALETVTFEDGSKLTTIDKNAFSDCSAITQIIIPANVTKIGESAFANNSALTSVTLGKSVQTIGNGAFGGCMELANVVNYSTLEITVGSDGNGAVASNAVDVTTYTSDGYKFVEQKSAGGEVAVVLVGYTGTGSEITLPAFLGKEYKIGDGAFAQNSAITSVTVPVHVTKIGASAFSGCDNLKSVTIEDGKLTSIGGRAFESCGALESIYIPQCVIEIGESAFNDCSKLQGVYITDLTAWFNISFGDAYSNPLSHARNLYVKGTSESYELLTSLVIPGDVTTVNRYAFYNATCITSITVPANVTAIGDNAFEGCKNLVKIVNYSSLTLTIGGTDNGYVAYYAKIITGGETKTQNGYVYLEGETANLLIDYTGTDTELVLPDTLGGKSYSIDDSMFENNASITSITLGSNVTEIGKKAFSGCTSLKSFVIPASTSLKTIGDDAFAGCTGLIGVYISDLSAWCKTTFVAENATQQTSNPLKCAEKLYLDDGEGNYSLVTDLVIPDDVTKISDYAFSGATCLQSVTVPAGVTSIGKNAFDGCIGLTSFVFADGSALTTIGDGAFNNAKKLTSFTVPSSVTTIGKNAFDGCIGLTSIIVPAKVTTIGDDAFDNCSKLATVVNYSKDITLTAGSSDNGKVAYYATSVFNFDGNVLKSYSGEAPDVTLPDFGGTEYTIGASAFKDNTFVKSITIPANVTSIDDTDKSFDGCVNLETVVNHSESFTLTAGSDDNGRVAYYATSVFNFNGSELTQYSCTEAELVLPELEGKTYTIREGIFQNNTTITSVTIPKNVTAIGESAFEGCANLATVENYSNLKFTIGGTDNGAVAQYATKIINHVDNYAIEVTTAGGAVLTAYTGDDTSLTLPAFGGGYSIGADAFKNNTAITSVTIPANVKTIGESAFYGCSGLTTVTFAKGSALTSIGNYAFKDCTSLSAITVPASVTSIGTSAFDGCVNLQTVANYSGSFTLTAGNDGNGGIAKNATAVFDFKSNALSTYSGTASDIVLPDFDGNSYTINTGVFKSNNTIKNVTIPANVTKIGKDAFRECTSLTSVRIEGNSLTEIGSYVFRSTALKSIAIPASVTKIGKYAFADCSGLTSVTFGVDSKLNTISTCCFWKCSSIKSIVIPASVTSIEAKAFAYWTSGQTIYFVATEAGSGWDSQWAYACSANKVYGYTES